MEYETISIFLPFFFEMCKIGQQTSLLNHYFLYYISLHYICTLFYVLTDTCVQHCLVIFSFYLIRLECWPSCVLVLWKGLCLNPPRPGKDGGGAPDCKGRAYPGLDLPGNGMYSVFPNGSKGGYLGGGRLVKEFLPLLY